jgi:general secretion pathway protein A
MYLDFYKLKTKPFQITVDPKFLWLGEKHKEALATLRYGIVDNRGFLLLTGEVGTGKTILINRLVSTLNLDTVVATLPDPDLQSMDFYNLLADGFKMKRTFDSKAAFLIALRDFLHQSHADQKHVVLIIDESQRLNHHLMEDIRVLSNIELQDRKLINIFFVGQQEFNSILNTPQNRALAQRITVRYHIEALNIRETGQYIAHRLKVAGSNEQLFDGSAVEEVYQFSGGIPRLINIICDHALLTGYSRGIKKIDAKTILECAQELRIPNKTGIKPISETPQEIGKNAPAELKAPKQAAPATVKRVQRTGWKLVYISMILMLGAAAALAINHFAGDKSQQWGDEELTPQKYRTTLEKEKELLEQRLREDDPTLRASIAPVAPAPTPVEADPDAPKNDVTTKPPASSVNTQENPKPAIRIAPPESKGAAIKPLPLIKEKITIQFMINSNEIDDQSYPTLDRIASFLADNPVEIINIRGYTDSSGSSGYNESVSRFRANAVKSYLIGKGVAPDNINIFAMGASDPIASNDTQEGRRINRRVEIEFPKN